MKVGVPAPAGGISKQDFENKFRSFERSMRALGLEVEVAPSVLAGGKSDASYLAATDSVRAHEFMAFIQRKDIHGIVCMRGGYGVMRMLPLLDFNSIRENPKVISGYSDITALLNSITQRCNLATFHGPIAGAELDTFTQKWFVRMVCAEDIGKASGNIEFESTDTLQTISAGQASGPIAGGNLTLIASTMGTPYEVETQGKVLFLEDVGEKAYRVDRMLTQLLLAGKLQKCAAILLGQFTEAEDAPGTTTVDTVLRERLSGLGMPVLANFPVGHVREKFTMPIGVSCMVDANRKSIRIDGPTVRVSPT
jgi:muramoyltetrapeptide carboxypeptidase